MTGAPGPVPPSPHEAASNAAAAARSEWVGGGVWRRMAHYNTPEARRGQEASAASCHVIGVARAVVASLGMKKSVGLFLVALLGAVTACGTPSAGSTIGTSHASGVQRYATVRDLVAGAEQHQSREQLLAIAEFIRRWEQDPFLPTTPPNPGEDPSTIALLLMWLTASPDVHVTLCAGVAALAEEQGGEGAATGFMIGAGFGMAAYMIENPAEAVDPDSDRVQGAGLESGLRWFEAYRRRGQAHGAPILDELIELRRQGGRAALQAYHRDHQRCGRHVGEPLPGE